MPAISVTNFAGTFPIKNPKNLEVNQAQTASNVDLSRGDLRSMSGITAVSTLATTLPKTLWRCGSSWITLGTGVTAYVVDSFIQESLNRFYFSDGTFPKQSNSTLWGTATSYRLGVTPPAVAPTLTITGTGDGTTQATVSYVFTMVTAWGEESAPSPATAVIDVENGEGVNLSVLTTPTDTANNFQYKRIYRLASGTTGAEYCYLDQIAFANTTYSDYNAGSLKTVSTDVLETTDWAVPPTALLYLTQAHNGMLIGAYGKDMYVSEPFVPYAYPTDYVVSVDSDITGIGATKEFILILSSSFPYIVTGATPDSLVSTAVPISTKCMSQRGVVSTADGVYYPASDGLYFCNGSSVVCVTANTYTGAQWTALGPSNFIAEWYGDCYTAFVAGSNTGISVDPQTGEVTTFTIPSTITVVRDVYHYSTDDTLYVLGTDNSGVNSYIISFDTNATGLTFTWKSKKFVSPDKFNCAKVKGNYGAGSLTFKYYLNGSEKLSKSLTAEGIFRLPSDCGATDKEFQLSGTLTSVDSVQLATSASELV
jgi:hypothetical protein